MSRFRLDHFTLISLPLLLLLSCAREETGEPAVIPSVIVMASDYSFQMPDTVSAGVTTLRLMNHGQEPHHLVLIRLGESQTLADFQRVSPGAPLPPGMVYKGGPNFAAPGGAAEATLDLSPGRYVAVCLIPSPDGQVHVAKGMMRELVVAPPRAPEAATAPLPEPDVTIRLTDYAFESSKPLIAGRQVIRIENGAEQWHEVVFLKLEPGKTIEDFGRWVEQPEGPPPASPVHGASPLGPGESNTVTVELVPGDYGFICFLPDATDRRPHFMHGMVQHFRVM